MLAIFKAGDNPQCPGSGVIMKRRFIVASILGLALALACLAQSSGPKPETRSFGEIHVVPLKDLIVKTIAMCNSSRSDRGMGSFSVIVTFEVDPDGSIPDSSMKPLKSSRSAEIDKAAFQIVRTLGESHVLGMLSGQPAYTLEIRVADNISHIAFGILAATPEDARAKSDQLQVVVEHAKLAQRNRDSLTSELLSYLAVKAEDKRVTVDLALPCSRAAELLRMLNSK